MVLSIFITLLLVLQLQYIKPTFGADEIPVDCYHPTGWFASESLLSKPSITYDIEPLKKTGNVTVKEPSVLYRSHYDDRIGVILTPLEIFEEKGLDIRFQLPTKVVTNTTNYIEASKNDSVTIIALDLMKGRDFDWVLDLDYRPNTIDGPPIQVSNLTKANLKITIIPTINETLPGALIHLEVRDATSIRESDLSEFSRIFDAIGYPTSFETFSKGLKFTSLSRTTQDLASALDIQPHEFKWDEAMKMELNWLIKNRLIKGLSNQDIEELSALAPYAWGEHNFKSRYYQDKWILGINEDMINANYTREYTGPPNCQGFQSTLLPISHITDFNITNNPLDILTEQTVAGQAIRVVIVAVFIIVIGAFIFLWRRKRRKNPKE